MDQDQNKRQMSKYQVFWNWFLKQAPYIYTQLETDTENIALDLTEKLKEVDDQLEFEIPFDFEEEYRELIISADGILDKFQVVKELVSEAPDIPHWKITAFRPRLHQRNQIIDLDGISMDYHDVFFTYRETEEGLEVDAYIKGYDGSDNRYVHLYFLLLDSLIGEYDSVTVIKRTSLFPFERSKGLYPFQELLQIVDEYKNKKR